MEGKMNCVICGGAEFHELGEMHRSKTLRICKTCGAVGHKPNPEGEAKVLDFYRKDYRKMPTSGNLITTGNKLNYIVKFLADFLKDKKGLVCCDVGAATGYLPNWLRRIGHKATGTEYTITFRRFSEHFYGIPLTEEIDKKRKYDLISLYHVAEHMVDPVAKLKEYRDCLTDSGVIFISVPFMVDCFDEQSGAYTSNFNDIFHENHLHALSVTACKNMFRVAGLEVIKEDLTTYGQTYLVKKAEATQPAVEDWKAVLKKLESMKSASDLFQQGKFKEAANIYPNYPDAVIGHIMQTCGKDNIRQQDEWNAIKDKPVFKNFKTLSAYAAWLMQQERRQEADQAFDVVLNMRLSPDIIYFKAQNMALMGQHKAALGLFVKAGEMMPHQWGSMMNWAAKMASSIPTWDEKAVAELKEAMYQQNKHAVTIEPKDAVMAEVTE